MGLKDLHLLAGDDRAPHATDQRFRFADKQNARDDFDPPWTVGLLEHGPSRYTRSGLGSNGPCKGGVGRESPANLRIFGGYPIVLQNSCGFPRPPFKEIAVNKAELTSALAMRTKM